MPTARDEMQCTVCEGKIYVIGGHYYSVPTGELFYNINEAYDPVADTWSILQPMPYVRRDAGSASVGGKVYIIGGNYTSYYSTVQRYDPATDTWSLAAPLSTPCAWPGCAVLGGKIYVAGGYASGIGVFNRLPYAARDLLGCTASLSWIHRGTAQSDEFCFIGGGLGATGCHDGFFRFHTR